MRIGRYSRWLLAAGCAMAPAVSAQGRLLGGNIALTGAPCSFPDVAYSPEEDCYLVVWVDYGVPGLPAVRGRLLKVDSDGLLPQPTFAISNPADRSFYPAVAYNPTAREFLVTWDREDAQGISITVYGRRIRASDGALQQAGFQIASAPSVQRSAAAWSTTSQRYLVAYSNFDNAFGRFISSSGQPLTSDFLINDASGHAFFPAVCWAPSGDVFLITWDHGAPNSQDFIGRRVISAAGQWLTAPLTITSGAAESRSTIAHDDVLGRWLVQYNDASHAEQSYDQYGRFIKDDGTLDGPALPIANSPVFEGDTILGSDIAFAPAAGLYFSSFVVPTGISGQLCDRNGRRLHPQVVLGTIQGPDGNFMRHNNAADTRRNQFLTVWEGNPVAAGPTSIYAQLYASSTPVTDLSAEAGPARIRLRWTDPNDSEMTQVTIRASTTAPPASPDDGALITQLDVTPGASASFLHTGLDHRQTYYYAVFAHEFTPIYAPGAVTSARPVVPGELDGDGDVDQADFGLLQACLVGSGQSYGPGCDPADLDSDGDVDQDDFEVFLSCLGGAATPPGCP
jgi:hypothetical protein